MSQAVGGSRKTVIALYAAGGLLLCGAGAVTALSLSGQVAWTAPLATAGWAPGLIGIGGAVLLGLGAATHALGSGRGAQEASNSQLSKLCADVVSLRAQVELVRNLQNQILATGKTEAAGEQAPSADQMNAIFRIAASLDQLGARLDGGLKSQFSSVDEKLNILARVLGSLRDTLQRQGAPEERASQDSDAVRPAQPEPATSSKLAVPQPQPARAAAEPRAALPVKSAPGAPSLGILDELDDHGHAAPRVEPLQRELVAKSPTTEEAKNARLDALMPDAPVRHVRGS